MGLVLGSLFSEGVSMLTEQDLRDLLIAIEGVWEVNGTEHYVECCAALKRGVSSTKDYYNAALDFLTHCSEVGLYYQ